MKLNAQNTWLCAGVLVALTAVSVGRADDSSSSSSSSSDSVTIQPDVHIRTSGGFGTIPDQPAVNAAIDRANAVLGKQFGTFTLHGPNSATATIRKAAEAVRDAKDSQEKEAAQKKLIE